jgi:putative addiction module component (TIGR02574 family)
VSTDLRAAIRQLDRDQQLELLDELWALVRDDAMPVPPSHRRELDARLREAEADPSPGEAWADVKARLLGQK